MSHWVDFYLNSDRLSGLEVITRCISIRSLRKALSKRFKTSRNLRNFEKIQKFLQNHCIFYKFYISVYYGILGDFKCQILDELDDRFSISPNHPFFPAQSIEGTCGMNCA